MLKLRCGETEGHEPHVHTIKTNMSCSGRTTCMQWSHAPHIIVTEHEAECDGLLNLTFRDVTFDLENENGDKSL